MNQELKGEKIKQKKSMTENTSTKNQFGKETFRYNHFFFHKHQKEYVKSSILDKFQKVNLRRTRVLCLASFFVTLKVVGKAINRRLRVVRRRAVKGHTPEDGNEVLGGPRETQVAVPQAHAQSSTGRRGPVRRLVHSDRSCQGPVHPEVGLRDNYQATELISLVAGFGVWEIGRAHV